MPVDNQMYEVRADDWWDESSPFGSLSALDPLRFGYFEHVLTDKVDLDPARKRVLDVGCGGGLLAERFSRLGCEVTGIDPSSRSIEVAREHARAAGLEIDYRVGAGERLPFEDGYFAVVCCADVLEHVDDAGALIAESARVLQSGGVFLYLTVNRTLRSWLIMIKLLQDWRWLRYLEPHTHDWRMFIKPSELQGLLHRHAIEHGESLGIVPGANPLRVVRLLRRYRCANVTAAQVVDGMRMKLGRDLSGVYVGFGTKGS